jgi:NAD(P)-dependent dehydrogenase (short-subunit alcohol dehydrogenase family)
MLRSQTGNTQVAGLLADLSSQAEVRRVAGEFLSRYPALDVLVNNVGGTLLSYQESPDGYEMTWALNYLGHFLLTHLLLEALQVAASKRGEARIVELTSSVYRWSSPHFDQLPKGGIIQGVLAYSKAKRAVIVFTVELARRLRGTGVTINAVTPGLVKSDIAKSNGWPIALLMRTINLFALPTDQGIKPIVRLAAAPELCGKSGKYFYQDKGMPDDPSCVDPAEATRLWQLSEKMTGM